MRLEIEPAELLRLIDDAINANDSDDRWDCSESSPWRGHADSTDIAQQPDRGTLKAGGVGAITEPALRTDEYVSSPQDPGWPVRDTRRPLPDRAAAVRA